MAESVKGLNPEILVWVRKKAGRSVSDVAQAIKKDPQVIEAWENGQAAPTYAQLETLAYKIYKRPIALFFFPEPPDEPDPEQSFRTLPDFEVENLSADTRFMVRKARALQISLYELNEGQNPAQRNIFRHLTVDPQSDAAAVARQVRDYLGIHLEDQRTWNYRRTAMDRWRASIQDVGIFVFKDSFKQKDISGFCLVEEEFPIIYINNSTAFSRQTFTLFHELAHILVQTNGVTKEDDSYIESLTGLSRHIEVFCNRFAAELLVPSSDFDNRFRSKSYNEEEIASLADHYLVSREVILRKLLEREVVTPDFYRQKATEWAQEYEERAKGAEGGNYYATQATYLGEKFLKLAFRRYFQGSLSIEQLAEYLNVRASSVPGLEHFALL